MIYRLIKKIDAKKKIGKKIVRNLLADEKKRTLSKYLIDKVRTGVIRQISNPRVSHLKDILQISLQHISPVTAPLALISQIPHSGGSRLSRLLDGHSKLHAHPHAFAVDSHNKDSWPKIDIKGTPEEWLNIFSKTILATSIREDFRQDLKDKARFPFMYLPILQKQIFNKYLASFESVNTRNVFSAHMTACFGAWLNYQNHGFDKKFVTTYAPGLIMQNEAMDSFFEIYPDGRLISIIRDPEHWFVSASRLEPQLDGDAESALSNWKESVRAAVGIRKTFGDRVCLIKFEDLVTQTESVMRFLSEFLGIPYEDILLEPTFNRIPIPPADEKKIDRAKGKFQHLNDLSIMGKDQRVLIKKITATDYQAALRETVPF
jgi:hypothetical protein